MPLCKENNFESQFKFDCSSSALLAEVGLSGASVSYLLQPTLQFSWSLLSIPFFYYQPYTK
jgi:hypothetical protein